MKISTLFKMIVCMIVGRKSSTTHRLFTDYPTYQINSDLEIRADFLTVPVFFE